MRRDIRSTPPGVRVDPWSSLRSATPARIGLGRNGDSMPLRPVLDFQLAHAEARDAIYAVLDVEAVAKALVPRSSIVVKSAATDRGVYLRRPDLGRDLDPASRSHLLDVAGHGYDCVFVISDGLSAIAASRHAVAVIDCCLRGFETLSVAPIVIATQARVALGDAIGQALNARLSVVLIGERPGLSVADSLGIYITYAPKIGRRDSERNCISNVHANGGLDPESAACKLRWLMAEALSRCATGITLKDGDGSSALSA